MLAPEFLSRIIEKLELKKPCQAGYEQIGMKMKDGKKVPNCVPIEAKEDLSSQKVELGLADDIKSLVGQLKAKNDELKKAEKEAVEFGKKLTQMYKSGEKLETTLIKRSQSGDKLVDRGIKISDKAEKAAKDLGVSPSAIAGYSELSKLLGDVEVQASIVQDTVKGMFTF